MSGALADTEEDHVNEEDENEVPQSYRLTARQHRSLKRGGDRYQLAWNHQQTLLDKAALSKKRWRENRTTACALYLLGIRQSAAMRFPDDLPCALNNFAVLLEPNEVVYVRANDALTRTDLWLRAVQYGSGSAAYVDALLNLAACLEEGAVVTLLDGRVLDEAALYVAALRSHPGHLDATLRLVELLIGRGETCVGLWSDERPVSVETLLDTVDFATDTADGAGRKEWTELRGLMSAVGATAAAAAA